MPPITYEVTYDERDPWRVDRIRDAVHRLRKARADKSLESAMTDPELQAFTNAHPKLAMMLQVEDEGQRALVDRIIEMRKMEEDNNQPAGIHASMVTREVLAFARARQLSE